MIHKCKSISFYIVSLFYHFICHEIRKSHQNHFFVELRKKFKDFSIDGFYRIFNLNILSSNVNYGEIKEFFRLDGFDLLEF